MGASSFGGFQQGLSGAQKDGTLLRVLAATRFGECRKQRAVPVRHLLRKMLMAKVLNDRREASARWSGRNALVLRESGLEQKPAQETEI
jgi:hypothetical protein